MVARVPDPEDRLSRAAAAVAEEDAAARRAVRSARIFAVIGFALLAGWALSVTFASGGVQFAGHLVLAVLLSGGALGAGARSRRAHVGAQRARIQYIEELSYRDELTGLYNYRWLRDQLAIEVEQAARDGTRRALALIDVDAFKDVNDRLGSAAGDAILRAVGEELRTGVGEDGLVVRHGGDQFGVLLAPADRGEAIAVAERLIAGVAEASAGALPGNQNLRLTASHGLALFPEDAPDAEALAAAAERVLQEAKRGMQAERAEAADRHARDVFFAIGEAMGRSLDAPEMLDSMLRAVGETLGVHSCVLRVMDERGELQMRAAYSTDPEMRAAVTAVEQERPITREEATELALLTGKPIYVDDPSTSDLVLERYRKVMPPGIWMLNCGLPPPREALLSLLGRHDQSTPPPTSLVFAITQLVSSAIGNCVVYEGARNLGERLSALGGIGGLLFGEGDFEERLGAVARRIVEVTGFDVVTLDTLDPEGKKPFCRHFFARPYGPGELDERTGNAWRFMRPQISDRETAEFLANARDVIVIEDAQNSPLIPDIYRSVVVDSGTQCVVVVPVVWQGELKGIFYFSAITRATFTEGEIVLMRTIAAQLAPSLQIAAMHVELQRSYDDLRDAHLEAIVRLAYAAEARDPYTESNLNRIKEISEAIARRMGVSGELLEGIGYGSIVHDLGKLRIPDSILVKPGQLSDDEWKVMKLHPVFGAELIGQNAFYEVAREAALYHHERWDGSGYPHGLQGEAIPLAARIISVADVYDALTTARPYKNAWPLDRALAELQMMAGVKLCPHSMSVFMELWGEGVISEIDARTANYGLDGGMLDRQAA
ncbi:MAG: HD domain-containing phosphohydrolase [Dehalococcoidia bacterium]